MLILFFGGVLIFVLGYAYFVLRELWYERIQIAGFFNNGLFPFLFSYYCGQGLLSLFTPKNLLRQLWADPWNPFFLTGVAESAEYPETLIWSCGASSLLS
jgi:hypothetical protein